MGEDDELLRRKLHDLRGALNAISMNAELGKLLSSRGGEERVEKAFRVILEQSAECSRILEDLRQPQPSDGSPPAAGSLNEPSR